MDVLVTSVLDELQGRAGVESGTTAKWEDWGRGRGHLTIWVTGSQGMRANVNSKSCACSCY